MKNFSDFLCEIKERIREEDDKAVMGDTIRKGTCRLDSEDKQMSFNETERLKIKPNQKRTLSFEVRLENEKIELQKYRKILDRELVKTHSIDNIQL